MRTARASKGRASLAFLQLAVAALAVARPGPAVAQAPAPAREGGLVQTGGTLDFRDPDERRQARPSPRPAVPRTTHQRDWIDEVVETVFGLEPPKPARPRVVRQGPAVPSVTPQVAQPRSAPGTASPVTTSPVTTSPVTTASIPIPRPPEAPPAVTPAGPPAVAIRGSESLPVHPGDAEAQIVRDAARAQTRVDLLKLEFARRTYDEQKIAGQPVFATRPEWRVLERARDAWTDAELSASKAAGFEANAYINDVDKRIVVAIGGTQDLRRDFIEADIWRALIQAQSPQQFFLAKSYIRSVIKRYQAQGYQTECVGHSLGGAACAYAASELGIRAIVVNPISAGKLPETARLWITNYVVDGDIAAKVYAARGNGSVGDIQRIADGSEAARAAVLAKYGPLAGPILIIRDLQNSVKVHQIDRALDLIAAHAGAERVK